MLSHSCLIKIIIVVINSNFTKSLKFEVNSLLRCTIVVYCSEDNSRSSCLSLWSPKNPFEVNSSDMVTCCTRSTYEFINNPSDSVTYIPSPVFFVVVEICRPVKKYFLEESLLFRGYKHSWHKILYEIWSFSSIFFLITWVTIIDIRFAQDGQMFLVNATEDICYYKQLYITAVVLYSIMWDIL